MLNAFMLYTCMPYAVCCMLYAVCCMLYAEGCAEGGGEGGGVEDEVQTDQYKAPVEV